jgi:transposase
MIRTSKFTTRFSNKNKLEKLNKIIDEYQDVVKDFIDDLWGQLDEKFESPKMISTKNYHKHGFSQRLIKCAATQACGIVRGLTEKKRRIIWTINELNKTNENTSFLEEKLSQTIITKPEVKSNFKCEINSICCDLKERRGFWFLQLKSLGNITKFRLPLKLHKQANKWINQGKILNSFLISKDKIEIRFEIKNFLKEVGTTVGVDQGIATCLSLSDGQATKEDKHGWNLSKILSKLCKKKKGSKNFRDAQIHRKNYINYSINQLNISEIKEIRLERLKNVRRGKSVERFRSHWTYSLIKEKLLRFCEENKVCFVEQSCTYRSQRCANCGLVRKSNRNNKIYACCCGNVDDSDLNASKNHEVDLPSVDHFRHLGYNKFGFYWLETGFYDLDGKELTVPYANKI